VDLGLGLAVDLVRLWALVLTLVLTLVLVPTLALTLVLVPTLALVLVLAQTLVLTLAPVVLVPVLVRPLVTLSMLSPMLALALRGRWTQGGWVAGVGPRTHSWVAGVGPSTHSCLDRHQAELFHDAPGGHIPIPIPEQEFGFPDKRVREQVQQQVAGSIVKHWVVDRDCIAPAAAVWEFRLPRVVGWRRECAASRVRVAVTRVCCHREPMR